LAEDNPVNQRVAVRVLSKLGADVTLVDNGRAALEAIGKESFDAVLMDVQMPEMDGFEATRAVRAGETAEQRRLPIIAMTAHAMTGDRERCLEAGMDDYVSKPFETSRLIETILRTVNDARAAASSRPSSTDGSSAARETRAYCRPKLLERSLDDEALAAELVDLFLESRQGQLDSLSDAARRADFAAAHRSAHTLKGSLATLCAEPACAAAAQVESAATAGELGRVEETLAVLEAEVGRLVAELEADAISHKASI
jgi:two-component system, sensor histidine kinase and response regulator